MGTAARPLRADAERNRLRILDAARELFAARGLDVSMEEIAGAAGVGVGTLYRRFGDRDALIDAMFEEKAAELVGYAETALTVEDPWEALTGYMRNMCRSHARDRGLKEAMMTTGRGRERMEEFRDRIRPVASQVLQRAKDAGVVRPDLEPFDIPMMNFAVSSIAERTRDESPEYFERLLTIFIDGIAARPGTTPMAAPPLAPDEFLRCIGNNVRRA